jgi:hypothetical protein
MLHRNVRTLANLIGVGCVAVVLATAALRVT